MPLCCLIRPHSLAAPLLLLPVLLFGCVTPVGDEPLGEPGRTGGYRTHERPEIVAAGIGPTEAAATYAADQLLLETATRIATDALVDYIVQAALADGMEDEAEWAFERDAIARTLVEPGLRRSPDDVRRRVFSPVDGEVNVRVAITLSAIMKSVRKQAPETLAHLETNGVIAEPLRPLLDADRFTAEYPPLLAARAAEVSDFPSAYCEDSSAVEPVFVATQ